MRERLKMDFDWRFSLGHASDKGKDFDYFPRYTKTGDPTGPAHPDFDDTEWRSVDVPHDWVVALGYDKGADRSHAYKRIGRDYPENSIGWYRKTFQVPQGDLGRRIELEFDGVYRNCEIWLNGHPVCQHQSGYTSFGFDVTDYINYGGTNVLVVRADAGGFELWSHEGAGIYRHVCLVKTEPLHVAQWGTYVTSEVRRSDTGASADLTIETTLVNEDDSETAYELRSAIVDPAGAEVGVVACGRRIDGWEKETVVQSLSLDDVALWSLESLSLYKLVTTVMQATRTVDTYETAFGIRTIEFDPDKGFFLNGEPVKLKGACTHQDHGGLGVAVPDSVHEYRVERLKEMGANAMRCAHNWVSPEALDACDRLGFLVMNEARMSGSSPELLRQLSDMVRRDRNHPSVIIWSLGNEEMAIQTTVTGQRIMKTMRRVVRSLDATRPVTLAVHGGDGGPVNESLDILGCNYLNLGNLDELHEKEPQKPIFVSEAVSTWTTRGVYERDEMNRFTAYDDHADSPDWGRTAESMWRYVAERDFVAGTFIWTGFDYGGEAPRDRWPSIHCSYGAMDRACFPKDNFFYYQSWWSAKTVLHLLPHWNWEGREGEDIQVWCHSNCEEVEVFVNSRSLGRQQMQRNSHLEWTVTYEPGTVEARGYSRGALVATEKIETTGAPAAIRLKPHRAAINADNQDVSMVTVEVIDGEGRVVPTAENVIGLRLNGAGKISGVCNGDPACHITEDRTTYPAFNGLLMVCVQSGRQPGEITLEATSEGLEGATAVVEAVPCRPEPYVPSCPAKTADSRSGDPVDDAG